jgi:hypothetical protein
LSSSLGFWVKANRTGTYSGAVRNGAGNRSYPFSFTVNSSGTWEYKTVTIPGDTTGTWAKDNTAGMWIAISMAQGSNYTGTANTWAASYLLGVTGTINGVAATSDYFQLTGVVLIPGSIAPSAAQSVNFIRPFDEELILCQRYYEKSYNYGTVPGASTSIGATGFAITGLVSGANPQSWMVYYKTKKRATGATITTYSTDGTSGTIRNFVAGVNITSVIYDPSEQGFKLGGGGSTQTHTDMVGQWVADSRM